MADDLVYFLPVEGRAQVRFGSAQFIGCRRDRASGRMVWTIAPTGIGKAEHARYRREYTNAVRRGDLVPVSVETLPGGGQRATVLPGGPAPSPKNGLPRVGSVIAIGGAEPAQAERETAAVDAAPPGGPRQRGSSKSE